MTTQLSFPLPPVLPSRIQAAVEAVLLGMGFPYRVVPYGTGWHTQSDLEWPHGVMHLHYYTCEEINRLLLHIDTRIDATEATRAETSLLLGWINAYQHLVTYQLDPDCDKVLVRIALAEELGQTIDAASVERMSILAYNVDRHYRAKIREVAEWRSTARDAFSLLVPTAW